MANLCLNELTLKGETAELLRFFEGLKGQPARYANAQGPEYEVGYTQNTYVPVPAKVQANPFSIKGPVAAKQRLKYGYYWQIANWGSKWDAFYDDEVFPRIERAIEELKLNPDASCAQFFFETAWSPIVPWVKAVAVQFPDIAFELHYSEEVSDFGGVLLAQGDQVEHRQYESALIYQLAEHRSQLTDLLQIKIFDLEYELRENGLMERPDESDKEAYEEWKEEFMDWVDEMIEDHFGILVDEGYTDVETLQTLFFNQFQQFMDWY